MRLKTPPRKKKAAPGKDAARQDRRSTHYRNHSPRSRRILPPELGLMLLRLQLPMPPADRRGGWAVFAAALAGCYGTGGQR
jgi:hypothetical protein